MKKTINIIIKILMILTILHFSMQTTSFADGGSAFWGEVFESGKNFLETGRNEAFANKAEASDKTTMEIVTILYDTLQTLGVFISIGIGGVLGIKFMISSAEDKAKIKEYMVPYVVGCIVIFGAFGIWKLVINVMSGV